MKLQVFDFVIEISRRDSWKKMALSNKLEAVREYRRLYPETALTAAAISVSEYIRRREKNGKRN